MAGSAIAMLTDTKSERERAQRADDAAREAAIRHAGLRVERTRCLVQHDRLAEQAVPSVDDASIGRRAASTPGGDHGGPAENALGDEQLPLAWNTMRNCPGGMPVT